MTTAFQFVALGSDQFAPLFTQTDEELRATGARRMIVDQRPGFPCRVSLADAAVGETVILLPYAHHDVDSPYRSSGPIFVRSGAATATPGIGEVPAMLTHRQLSLRAYDDAGMMVAAEVLSGTDIVPAIMRFFADTQVSYLHVHNAKPGCFNCAVVRA